MQSEHISKINVINSIAPEKDADGVWTFTTDKDFRVMQLTDVHIGGGWMCTSKDTMALNAVAAMVTAEKPDLVIMDITMPVKTGIEALGEIKGKHPEAKIVMCSAMGQEAMVVEAIKLGALDFIVKPFKPDRILATVSKILG